MKLQSRSKAGFLLSETIVSMAIYSAVTLVLMMGYVSLERSLTATTEFATSHSASMRISDYLALDLRRATSIQSTQSDTNDHRPRLL